jgi:hypothetical protein
MLTSVGAFAHPGALAIHSTAFVFQDYVPAGIIGLVVLGFGAAIVTVAARRKDVN